MFYSNKTKCWIKLEKKKAQLLAYDDPNAWPTQTPPSHFLSTSRALHVTRATSNPSLCFLPLVDGPTLFFQQLAVLA